jgi:hypothetical protein
MQSALSAAQDVVDTSNHALNVSAIQQQQNRRMNKLYTYLNYALFIIGWSLSFLNELYGNKSFPRRGRRLRRKIDGVPRQFSTFQRKCAR